MTADGRQALRQLQKLATDEVEARKLSREIGEAIDKLEHSASEARDVLEIRQVILHELATRLGHDLRTGLNAIIGFAGLLESDGDLAGDDLRYANKILSSGRDLLKACDLVERLIVMGLEDSN